MKSKLNYIIYKLWYWIGCKCWFFTDYNRVRDITMKKSKKSLEDAFTPQLQKLIGDSYHIGEEN